MSEGRCTLWVDPDKEEEEEEEEDEMSEEKKAALAAIEKPRKKLAAVAGDSTQAAWAFRTAPSKYDSTAVSIALSLQWPGAIAMAQGKRVLNFYTGWGLPQSNDSYKPPVPPAFDSEFQAAFDVRTTTPLRSRSFNSCRFFIAPSAVFSCFNPRSTPLCRPSRKTPC